MGYFRILKLNTATFFRKSSTRRYPEEPARIAEGMRGRIEVDMHACTLCGDCMTRCPTGAITVNKDGKTWSIQRMLCIQCGCCEENCKANSLKSSPFYTKPDIIKIADTYEKPDKRAKVSEEGSVVRGAGCVYCGTCEEKCPMGAITVSRSEKIWEWEEAFCTRCGLCVESCPKKMLQIEWSEGLSKNG
jgi:formate hydrogenlyase subunit 6/NADH:ubiquinone oxidoreductase subunit I